MPVCLCPCVNTRECVLSECIKVMQRAFSSNGWHSKSKEFQKETALRAAGFELCLCKAGRLTEKRLFTFLGGGENTRRSKVKVREPDRQGEREFTNWLESKGRNKREEGVADRKARKKKGEK